MKVRCLRRWLGLLMGLVCASGLWAAAPSPSRGVADFRQVDFSQVGSLTLNGEWELYRNQLLSPANFRQNPPAPNYFHVPGNWNFPDAERGVFGFGTYRLLILLPPNCPQTALRLPIIGQSAKVFVNGQLIWQAGLPASRPEAAQSNWKPGVALLSPGSEKLEVVIQISNYDDNSTGLYNSLSFGPAERVYAERQGTMLFSVLIFGALLLMGLYHLGLFAFRSKDAAPFYFGLLCLILGLRTLFYDDVILLEVWPSLDFEFIMRGGYLSFSLGVWVFLRFLTRLFPEVTLRWVMRIGDLVCLGYSVIVLVAPTGFYTLTLKGFQLFTLAVGFYSLFVIIRAVIAKKSGALMFVFGFVLLFAATAHDIIKANIDLPTPFLAHEGLLLCLLFQSLILAQKFSRAFTASEEFSLYLKELNLSLERFIPKEVLAFLQKKSIVDISLGDHVERLMTVVFIDIRNFTSMSEKMTPTENFRFINSYLKRVGPLIRQFNGFVDKYMGDGIMALFPGDPDDALNSALAIRESLVQYNLDRAKAGYEPIRIGVGIHSGVLMMGTIGENFRMDSTVISDTVNVASRLEGLTKTYGLDILFSEQTLGEVKEPARFAFREVGRELVKGKSEAIGVLTLA